MKGVCDLNVHTIVVKAPGVSDAEVDGEAIALNVAKGVCYGLNQVGTCIWSMIADPAPIGDICRRLLEIYDVDSGTCQREVIDLLDEMLAEGLIEISVADGTSG